MVFRVGVTQALRVVAERISALVPEQVLILVGSGVARDRSGPGVARLARAGPFGVVNTWGAKGIFDWRSPHHFGTVGLQARDFELCGLASASYILASGVERGEDPRPEPCPVATDNVEPQQLNALAEIVSGIDDHGDAAALVKPALFARLAALVQPQYSASDWPMAPGRVVANLAAAIAERHRLFADAGLAGLWIARVFPTTQLGVVEVPIEADPGWASRRAADIADSAGAIGIAVTHAPIDEDTQLNLRRARRRGVGMVLDVWGHGVAPTLGAMPEGLIIVTPQTADDHARALVEALVQAEQGTPSVILSAVDLDRTQALIDMAGPVVAWQGQV